MTIGMSGVGACADPLPVRGAADGWKARHSKKNVYIYMLIENLDLNLRNVLVLNRSSSFAVSFQSSEQEIGCTGFRCEGSDLP